MLDARRGLLVGFAACFGLARVRLPRSLWFCRAAGGSVLNNGITLAVLIDARLEGDRSASRLELRIHALESDCLHGLGTSLLGRAMDAIARKDTKELQVGRAVPIERISFLFFR